MRYAFVNDNMIMKIEEHDSISDVRDSHLFQAVIYIDEMTPEPKLGWTWDGKGFYNKLPDVTPRQIRQALLLSGVSTSDIEQALFLLPEPTRSLATTEWEYSISFERRRPLVIQMGQMLGWTPDQLDELWILAKKL